MLFINNIIPNHIYNAMGGVEEKGKRKGEDGESVTERERREVGRRVKLVCDKIMREGNKQHPE